MTTPTANVPQFQLPSIHPQGTIQSPGDLGALGQSMQGLAPILMALQQMELERQRNQTQDKYVTGQLDVMRDRQSFEESQAAAAQAQNQRFGELLPMLGQTMTQMGGGQNAGSFSNPMIVPDFAQREFTTTDALSALPTQDRAEFSKLEPVKEKRKAEQEQEKERQSKLARRAFIAKINKVDPGQARVLNMVMDEAVASLPAAVQEGVFKRLSGDQTEVWAKWADMVNKTSLTYGEAAKVMGLALPEGIDPNGKREPLTNPFASMMFRFANEPPAQWETKDYSFYDRAYSAEKRIRELGEPSLDPATLYALANHPLTWGQLVSRTQNTAWGPYIAFLQVGLRKDTGAVFNATELPWLFDTYLPQGKNDPGKAFKREQRQILINDLGVGADRLLKQRGRNFETEMGALQVVTPKKLYDDVPGIPKPPGTP